MNGTDGEKGDPGEKGDQGRKGQPGIPVSQLVNKLQIFYSSSKINAYTHRMLHICVHTYNRVSLESQDFRVILGHLESQEELANLEKWYVAWHSM